MVANAEHREEAEEIWNVPAGRINAKPGYHTVEMWKRFSTPTDQGGDIDTIWVQVTNPGQSLPNCTSCSIPSRKLADKFLIVSDVYPTATTRIGRSRPAVGACGSRRTACSATPSAARSSGSRWSSRPGEARDDCWQIIAVAHRLFELGHRGDEGQGRPVPLRR